MSSLDALATIIPGASTAGDPAIMVSDVAHDSRAVPADALFFCIPGARHDGHAFARAAVEAGARALVVERLLDLDVPQIVVPSVRAAMGPMAAAVLGDPSRAMDVVGVTGTNGKTTTTFMLRSVIAARGVLPGVIGTVQTEIGDTVLPVTRTTPESADLQRLFAAMRDAGVGAVAMEVSSHGLDLGRVDGTWFACGVFTNLSQDHLDYHGTMDAYFDAKAALFTSRFTDRGVVNVDDAWGRRLIERVEIPITTVARDRDADVRAIEVAMDAAGSDVEVDVRGQRARMRVPVPGPYNVDNALCVLGVAVALGWPLEAVVAGIAATPGVPGRMERIDEGQGFTVLVDYAHTPDALDGALRAARAITPAGSSLIVVFGCGGDRDRTKRPAMGSVGATLADRTIVTSDNPRSEDPAAIIDAILDGARAAGGVVESCVDRREAIARAIGDARDGDVIVIAGKGHETGQEFADRTIPFDDRTVARDILRGQR